ASADDPTLRAAAPAATRLTRALAASRVRLQPWPLPQTIRALAAEATRALTAHGAAPAGTVAPYDAIDRALAEAADTPSPARGRLDAAGAYALFAARIQPRVRAVNDALST